MVLVGDWESWSSVHKNIMSNHWYSAIHTFQNCLDTRFCIQYHIFSSIIRFQTHSTNTSQIEDRPENTCRVEDFR